jgi:Fe-coproporphyrin III synthase
MKTKKTLAMPTDISIVLTYRCPMHCKMCNIWENPTQKEKELQPAELELLPHFKFVNVTGGEPFIRDDIEEILDILRKKADRIVISTSGWFTERIIQMARRFPDIGYRISIEGLSIVNDQLRGRPGGFDKGLKVLLELKRMGIKDIGFGITLSEHNSEDLLWLYELAKGLDLEFATAAIHNSYYFHKLDNSFKDTDAAIRNLKELARRLLDENKLKSWFRAFFNIGLINYIKGNPRLLPCEAGTVNCFLAPYGEIYPCNGMEPAIWMESMGNIRNSSSFEEIWNSEQAKQVREKVRTCPKNCWMVGTAAPVMKKYLRHPASWVIRQKLRCWTGKEPDLNTFPTCRIGQNHHDRSK